MPINSIKTGNIQNKNVILWKRGQGTAIIMAMDLF